MKYILQNGNGNVSFEFPVPKPTLQKRYHAEFTDEPVINPDAKSGSYKFKEEFPTIEMKTYVISWKAKTKTTLEDFLNILK